jgi:hypothetical protein
MGALTLVAIIGAGVALGLGNFGLAIGIGAGYGLLAWFVSPPRKLASGPMTRADFDRLAPAEIKSSFNPREARDRLVDIGLAVAFTAVVANDDFDVTFRRVQSAGESQLGDLLAAVVLILYCADSMRTQSWKEAENIVKLRGEALDEDIRGWRAHRLRPLHNYKMSDFEELSRQPAFRAFVLRADGWTKARHPVPPYWWTEQPRAR